MKTLRFENHFQVTPYIVKECKESSKQLSYHSLSPSRRLFDYGVVFLFLMLGVLFMNMRTLAILFYGVATILLIRVLWSHSRAKQQFKQNNLLLLDEVYKIGEICSVQFFDTHIEYHRSMPNSTKESIVGAVSPQVTEKNDHTSLSMLEQAMPTKIFAYETVTQYIQTESMGLLYLQPTDAKKVVVLFLAIESFTIGNSSDFSFYIQQIVRENIKNKEVKVQRNQSEYE